MIVKANVVYKDGKRGNEWFLVRFDHTPVKEVTKKKRRTGLCSIFYLTDDESYKVVKILLHESVVKRRNSL